MLLTTREAARALNVSIRRVQALIHEGRLKAREFGPVYIIESHDLEAVRVRKPGRPAKNGSKPSRKKRTSKPNQKAS